MPIDELCVIGHPSRYGGADTELDHQITCWQRMGIKVHICHTAPLDANLRSMNLEQRGCIYHAARDWRSLRGMHCIAFCNGDFLKNLPEIKKYARTTTFVNCMTWNFPLELEMQSRGLIDFHLYQTEHALQRVGRRLKRLGHYRSLMFTPFFDTTEFPFIENRSDDAFRFGRISRCDPDKFSARQLRIYGDMTAPLPKEGIILGWGDRVEAKLGKPPPYIRTFRPGELSQQDFYRFCDAVILTSDTFENLPRVGLEAMASGSVLVVDDHGGWRILVEDGNTGWLCRDENAFVEKSSQCAFQKAERDQMGQLARARLEQLAGLDVAARSWERVFRAWIQ